MKKWLSTTEALRYCELKGRFLTKIGLEYLGMLYRFIRKSKNGFHNEFSVKGLNIIIDEEIPPKGYITVEEASEKYDVNFGIVYKLIKNNTIRNGKFGYRKIYYINEKDLKNEIKRRKNKK